jgi:FkbM family methyltransferase
MLLDLSWKNPTLLLLLSDSPFAATPADSDAQETPGMAQTYPPPVPCSAAQMEVIRARFHTSTAAAQSPHARFHTPLWRATHCPHESWLHDHVFHNAATATRPFLALNVGCNKGLDAVDLARHLSQNASVSARTWKEAMPRSSAPICGVPADRAVGAAGLLPRDGVVHCIEPLPSTVASLRQALLRTHYSSHIVVTHAALSNTSGTALFPSGGASGIEGASLADCAVSTTTGTALPASCQPVAIYSLDGYLQQAGIAPTAMIDILLIDAEGLDYEILQGGRQTLRHQVRYLAFEVNMAGHWMAHSLVHAIDDFLADFVCYWAGKGQLWRMSHCMNDALRDLYEYKSWSNVVCVHPRETALAQRMEALFLQTIGHVS